MKATLAADTADLEAKQLDFDYTTIRSPITGRVSRYEVTEGNVVQSGQNGGTLLTTIVSVDPMYVYFDVDERTLLAVRRLINNGSMKNVQESAFPIQVGLADEDNFPHHGLVNFLDNRVDPGTGTLRVRGTFENHDGFLSPGLFVRCHLPLGEPTPRLLVAEEAIASDQEQKFVYVVNDANEVSYRPVQPGRLYDGMRVIEGGLARNEKSRRERTAKGAAGRKGRSGIGADADAIGRGESCQAFSGARQPACVAATPQDPATNGDAPIHRKVAIGTRRPGCLVHGFGRRALPLSTPSRAVGLALGDREKG